MDIPKTIKIGFHHFDVIYPYTFTETTGNLGQCSSSLNEIHIADTYLNKLLPDSTVIESLVHEIIHAINTVSKLKLFDDENGKTDEAKVDGLAEWLCMVLRDNQKLLELFITPKVNTALLSSDPYYCKKLEDL